MSDNSQLSHLINQRVPPPPSEPRRTPLIELIGRTVWLLGKLLPYALVAIVLRLVMARVFFVAGQSKIEGPRVPLDRFGLEGAVTLPMAVREATVQAYEGLSLPIPAWIAASAVSYAEFILPICLVLGFATRFAALALLIMTVVIQVFVAPDAFWSTHVYWASILLVLISLGPGLISIDHGIRRLHDGPAFE